jgi:LPXTG-motif cell wall-anchored protein
MKRIAGALVIALALGALFVAPASAKQLAGCYPGCQPGAGGSGRTITGDHWCPDSTVTIFVDGDQVGTAHVASDGTFSFTLPDSVPDGTHTITIEGLKDDCSTVADVSFTLVLGTTAFTGSNISIGVIALGALLIVGAGALIASRRRKVTVPDK